MILVKLLKGNCFKNTNKEVALSSKTAVEITPEFCNSNSNADPPKAAIQKKVINVGTNNTPNTNSRIVLPLDTRAMNIPTKGDHAIHQAQ